MTKDEVAALRPVDGIYDVGRMAPVAPKDGESKPGKEIFETVLQTPLTRMPIITRLSFEAGLLKEIYLDLRDDLAFDTASAEIIKRYGAGTVQDGRKEDQCVYRNGANFKVKSGPVVSTWESSRPDGQVVRTTLMETSVQVCPQDLRYDSVARKKGLRFLSIGTTDPSDQKAQKRLF